MSAECGEVPAAQSKAMRVLLTSSGRLRCDSKGIVGLGG